MFEGYISQTAWNKCFDEINMLLTSPEASQVYRKENPLNILFFPPKLRNFTAFHPNTSHESRILSALSEFSWRIYGYKVRGKKQ